jgi:Fe-Mn family superoxide dismutase
MPTMGKHTLPQLPYAYDALEPHIDARTMEIHHTKHHQKYTDTLNGALEKCSSEIQNIDILEILSDLSKVPDDVRGAINFGALADAINASFGSFADFKEKFSSTTAVIQGSGWGWLVYNPSSRKAEYKSMRNQTSPRTEGLVPLLGCDVWEHAYYLKYQNKRPDYIAAWWNVVNWEEVDNRLSKAK